MRQFFSHISKMKADFGNLVEISPERGPLRQFFSNISKRKDVFGNLLEKVIET